MSSNKHRNKTPAQIRAAEWVEEHYLDKENGVNGRQCRHCDTLVRSLNIERYLSHLSSTCSKIDIELKNQAKRHSDVAYKGKPDTAVLFITPSRKRLLQLPLQVKDL